MDDVPQTLRRHHAAYRSQLLWQARHGGSLPARLLKKLVRKIPYQKDIRSWLRSVLHREEKAVHPLDVCSGPPVSERTPPLHGISPTLPSHLSREHAQQIIASLQRRPRFSLLLRTQGKVDRVLLRSLRSVSEQFYPDWELFLLDPHSSHYELCDASPERICLVASREDALPWVTGEWVGFLQAGDVLSRDALTWMAAMSERYPKAQWLYSDQDYRDGKGNVVATHYKPDFSPELLLSTFFTDQFSVFSNKTLGRVPTFDIEYELALRLSEIVPRENVIHIPRVLHHSQPLTSGRPRSASTSHPQVVRDALNRRGLEGTVRSHSARADLYAIDWTPRSTPKVTIVIPTRNALADLKRCLRSVRDRTRYPNYEVVVVDNQSDDAELLRYLEDQHQQGLLRVHRYDAPFNHSAMNNEVVRACDSELVVLMNNDIELRIERWLEQFVATLQLDPAIAAVGGLLLYPDGTVQHAGVLLGLEPGAWHSHVGYPGHLPGYFGRVHALQEFSAVTAALMLVRRDAFLEVGAFSSDRYPTTYNDVDLCLRLRGAGYRCMYNPRVEALHLESKTRMHDERRDRTFLKRLREDWAVELSNDPFFHPQLSLQCSWFQRTQPYPIEMDFPEDLPSPSADTSEEARLLLKKSA